MTWEKIETNWAAMTRRIRADWPGDGSEVLARAPRGLSPASVLADRKTNPAEAGRQTSFAE